MPTRQLPRRIWLFAVITINLLIFAFGAQRQNNSVQVIENEIFIVEGSDKLRQLTHDGKFKGQPVLSPDRSKIIYYNKFDPYKAQPSPIIFEVLDARTGQVIQKISISWQARYINRLYWIDSHYVFVEGEGAYVSLIDIDHEIELLQIYGTHYGLSPDKKKIVFRKGRIPVYGVPQELETDYVELISLNHSLENERKKKSKPGWIVYPEVLPVSSFEAKRYADLDERHFLKSDFSWSPNSHMLAFVDYNRKALWLVVLTIDINRNGEIAATRKTFKIEPQIGEVKSIRWISSGRLINVEGTEAAFQVNIANST